MAKTSWEKTSDWYDKIVGSEGHFYHQSLIIPQLLHFWKLKNDEKTKVLDLACGQGILARHLPSKVNYLGIDIAPSLIQKAKQLDRNPVHQYQVGDLTKIIKLPEAYTHAAIILALQNIQFPEKAILSASQNMEKNALFTLVLNHPCFRIPRQTHWGIDEAKKLQYRRVDSYMSPLEIPIQMHPGKTQEKLTYSYHFPISSLTAWLLKNKFAILQIDELCSPKTSEGGKAKMENRARAEFPLFMMVHAKKIEV